VRIGGDFDCYANRKGFLYGPWSHIVPNACPNLDISISNVEKKCVGTADESVNESFFQGAESQAVGGTLAAIILNDKATLLFHTVVRRKQTVVKTCIILRRDV